MIVCGDIHGNLETFKALLRRLPDDHIVLTGDMIDRGPRASEVVQFVKENDIYTVLGNHEQMVIDYKDQVSNGWINHQVNGAGETLKSYEGKEDLFNEHIAWFKTLPIYLLFDDVMDNQGNKLLVSHSSVAKVWKWSEEHRAMHSRHFKNHIIWERDMNPQAIPGIFNVFGHTPVTEPKIIKSSMFIDTGCAYKGYEGYGKLTAVQYPSMQIFQQENIDE